jgi:hypothetical protein
VQDESVLRSNYFSTAKETGTERTGLVALAGVGYGGPLPQRGPSSYMYLELPFLFFR